MTDVVMTVQDIIEAAFGDENENTVNFRLVRLILLILSNQLRILDRHVQISIVRAFKKATIAPSNFSIAEVRVNTRTKKKKTKSSNKLKITQNITAAVAHFSTTSTIVRRFDSLDDLSSPVETISSEKILVVGSEGRSPQLVTRDEFDQLLKTVREIQTQIYPEGESGLEAEFERAIREGASFTSAMAALQLSSRLESFEKKLGTVFSLLTQLAKFMPGIDMKSVRELEESINKLQLRGPRLRVEDEWEEVELRQHTSTFPESIHSTDYEGQESTKGQESTIGEELSTTQRPFGITRPMLAVAMGHLRGDVIQHVKTFADTAQSDISNTNKKVTELEERLEAALDLEDRMYDLEATIENYGGEVSNIDAVISSKLTGYQDGITQMSLELETALDALEQTLNSVSADPEALAELGKKLAALQYDIASTALRYKDTDVAQKKLAIDLVQLGYEIEKINDTKADRSEVSDALRDKVGIGELNGMVRQDYYDAVQGELEKRIIASYQKFNDHEIIWQTAINQLIKSINAKADRVSVALVRKDIERYINALDDKTKEIADILGEPKAAATSKTVFREKECLSCSISVSVNVKNADKLPPLPRPRRTADGAEAIELSKDGDRNICYPGLPLPHPRDPRGDVCQRYCGAQLTLPEISRAQPGMNVSAIQRFISGTAESDQTSQDSGLKVRKPCIPCNKPVADASHPNEVNMASELGHLVSNTGNISSAGWVGPRKSNSVSLTMRLPSLSD